jgi:hypothetical protein
MSLIELPKSKLSIIQPIEIFDVNYNCGIGEVKVYESTDLHCKHSIFIFVGQATNVQIELHSVKNIAYWTFYGAGLIAFGQYMVDLGVEPYAVRITMTNISGVVGGWSVWWYAMRSEIA